MKKLVFILLFLVILVASFLAGSWFSRREGAKTRSVGVRSLQVGEEPENDTSSMPPGTVKITPEKQQTIGVRLGIVEKKPMTHILRVFGRVAPDETRVYRILAADDGWIVKTLNNPTGSLVKKDKILGLFIYSRNPLSGDRVPQLAHHTGSLLTDATIHAGGGVG